MLSFAACCHPIPGDEIMGYLSAGKGVVVHRADCPNVAEYRKFPERCVPMAWDRNVEGDYRVALRIEVENKPGVLAQVATILSERGINIESIMQKEAEEQDGLVPMILVTHRVTEQRMNDAITALEALADVVGNVVRIRVEQLN